MLPLPLLLLLLQPAFGQFDPHCSGRTAIVHLFEWTWTSIARECEDFLAPQGYCGVQVSPPNEHVLLPSNSFPWWQRYQPVSYKLESRSGSRQQFEDMVQRCNRVGVRIYVDAVVNHMAGMDRQGVGSGGSSFDTMEGRHDFPAVPYSDKDFTPADMCPSGCGCVDNYADPNIVRNCYLVGLADLYGATDYVRDKVAEYFNDLIDMGVAGFRVDAAKHMWPEDIAAIQVRLHGLATQHGFREGSRAFFYHEVIDRNDGAVLVDEYFDLGWVTEFRYSQKIGWAANGEWGQFGGLYDPGWGMGPPDRAFVFADNHDNQRGHGGGGDVVTHKTPFEYTAAISFMLAFDYGFTRVMSSYYFGEDTDQGPPNLGDDQFTTAEVEIKADGSCGGGWVCEHRWNAISKMVAFRTATVGAPSEGFWSEGDAIGMARAGKGYFAMTKGGLSKSVQTTMPGGQYTNIIDGSQVSVGQDGMATISITNPEGIFAICLGCDGTGPGPTPGPTNQPTQPTEPTEPQPTDPQPTDPQPTSSQPTDPPEPGTTASEGPPATTEPGWCCETLVLASTGGVAQNYPELLGEYLATGVEENSRSVWRHATILTVMHLHYTMDSHYKWEGWMVTQENNQTFGYISNKGTSGCPVSLTSGWEFQLPSGWQEDSTFTATCKGDGPGPQPTTQGPGPTGPGTTTTRAPGPGGVSPTMVVIKQQTMPGADVFIRGGVSPADTIDITHYDWPGGKDGWDSVNDWNVGDLLLDWGPEPEEGQGEHGYDPNNPELMAPAMGTPAAWTTDDPLKPAFYSINVWGPHHWVALFDMDCSQTNGGWFEFGALYSLGGEDGEVEISQTACTGEVGGTAPFTSTYHIARCGFLNLYEFDDSSCQIDDMPEIPPENDPCMPNCTPPTSSP